MKKVYLVSEDCESGIIEFEVIRESQFDIVTPHGRRISKHSQDYNLYTNKEKAEIYYRSLLKNNIDYHKKQIERLEKILIKATHDTTKHNLTISKKQ